MLRHWIGLITFSTLLVSLLSPLSYAQTDEPDLRIEDAEQYISLGQYEKALELLEEILLTEPENTIALWLRVRCYEGLGRFSELLAPMIPSYDLPPDLIDREAGSDNFDSNFEAGYEENDWHMTVLSWPALIAPIPSGWAIQRYGEEVEIYSLQKHEETEPSLFIRFISIHNPEYAGAEILRIQDVAAEGDHFIAYWPEAALLDRQIVDNEDVYFLAQLDVQGREREFMLLIFSGYLYEGWYYLMLVRGYEDVWAGHYPIIQAMAANLYDNVTLPVGVDLPDAYIDPEAFQDNS